MVGVNNPVDHSSIDLPQRRRSRRRALVLAASLVVVGLGVFVMVWFQPHKLFLDDTVDEALPGLVLPAPTTTTALPAATPAPEPVADEPMAPSSLADYQALAVEQGAPQVVTFGDFSRLDKDTTGTALLVAMPDGSLLVRFEGFRTGNGPDVFIELSRGGPDDGNYSEMLRLGRMKGNVGDQNYEIPPGTDLGAYQSVVIWCERFRSAFGAAPLVVPV